MYQQTGDTTKRWTALLNKKVPYPLKTGGAGNGVGRLEKANSKG